MKSVTPKTFVRKGTIKLLVVCLLLIAPASGQSGGDYDLSWYTIDGGGDMFSTGGVYELSGTIGQPDANATVLTGGDFELTGGLWFRIVPGDIDGDGDVDLADLAALLSSYGLCEGDPEYDADADFDADGCITLSDLAALLANYSSG